MTKYIYAVDYFWQHVCTHGLWTQTHVPKFQRNLPTYAIRCMSLYGTDRSYYTSWKLNRPPKDVVKNMYVSKWNKR